MHRLACLLVALAACGADSGPGTGTAMLTGVVPQVQSAAASSFTGPDAKGTKVMGWTIDLYTTAPGSDCKSKGTKIAASVGIYTNQAAGSAKSATLMPGDIGIVTTSPPDTSLSAAVATMGAQGVSGIQGDITITEFGPDQIAGTISAGGFDANQTGVTMTGMFMAPYCN